MSAGPSQCCRCCWCCCPRGCCVQTANIANIATTAITTISQDLSDLSPGLPVSHSALSAASLHPTSDNQSPTPRMTPALGHQATGKQNSAAWVAQTRSQDGANKEHMAKYRERGLGHLLSLFRGNMPIPGPGGNLCSARIFTLQLLFDHNFTIDCSIDVRPGRVKLQDMKQFPIKPDCAPTPPPASPASLPPRLRHCKNNKLSYLQSRGQSK